MPRAGVTVDRLTEVAADLADELGFDNVTITALARSFGVKEGSLYSHIRNMRDLRVKVALFALAELADEVSDALAGRSGKDALVAFADAYRDYAMRHPGRYAATRFPLDPETAAASAGVRHAEMTRAILRGYRVPESDQIDAIRLLGSTFHGFVSLEASQSFSHSSGIRDTDSSWSAILDVLHAALSNWPGTASRPAAS
ncbi:TetR/AcrR family transcriptional regulator [Nonomuraea fuscirosea]|jgi:AcrR family transcriptional regulator|uniref:TetR family transcriptional regulator n=1 Tax=Nonomuraea fuscirosea TaxID=1291556 RepID=A0A2T0N5P1_9ACTN|nr:TetR/AcrR family transcriptional regulator [Nonomuraea fuscirosea]PRX67637.1 TetR family transcriptional regulator [Nonomuraea fuscirosea]WSA57352.1 WHG domain-containing protein [Nonomuraea fuscirosea]